MPAIKHILVIRLSAMGDVAMIVPLVKALVRQYPEVRVTVLSRDFFRPFFDGIPNVTFHAADTAGKHRGFFGLLKLFRELEAFQIDSVADLHNVLRSKIITSLFALSGKKTATTDKARAEKKALTRPENKDFRRLTPIMQRHAEVLAMLGYPVVLDNPVFPEISALGPDVLSVTGEKLLPWIGIAPFAQHSPKEYPADLMQEVIDKLASGGKYKLILFGGGKEEITKLNAFASGSENVVVAAGKLKLRQELALMAHLDVMLSMDSGNGHMAAMQGVEVVTLWGATHFYAGFAPFNQPEANSLTADREKYPLLPTSIYGNKKVEGYEEAMRTITPQMVVDKVEELLRNR